MKAIAVIKVGSSNNFDEINIPVPELESDEVLVSTMFAGVNPVDSQIREGAMFEKYKWDLPLVLGWEISGIITKLGSQVTEFSVGDEIIAKPDRSYNSLKGSYAQFVAVKTNQVALKPEELPFALGAAIPLAGQTALESLNKLNLKSGQSVIIRGAGGGVGVFAMQIAKNILNLKVIGAGSTLTKQYLDSINIKYDDFIVENNSEYVGKVDGILDPFGSIEFDSKYIKKSGKVVTLKQVVPVIDNLPFFIEHHVLKSSGSQLKELIDYYTSGNIYIPIDSIYPLTKLGVQHAHEKIDTHHTHGKIIIEVS
ncbi:NADP-dependent oxidoreductase [Lactococcus lactis]|uniref:NADP-dependent oxidoreductase n=1 Tax=Lactococcus lactis TaxID=1358 RepID=UPI002418414A|nr:NADP-dependent oxidoreductase [Lactococcus lactis]MDG4967493.1 NADP-dependent oxidoreductase [Lactococcus lactis]